MDNLEEIKKQISELQSKVDKIENQKKEEKKGKRWRAEVFEDYYCVSNAGAVMELHEDLDNFDNYRYKTRNYFKSKEGAKEYQDIINTYYDLMDLSEELNNGEKIDWNDGSQYKYMIYYDFENDTLKRVCAFRCKDLGQIYCLDENFKEEAIEKIGEDRLKNLFKYGRR